MKPETVFRAMADGTRQRTLSVLCRHELSVSELVDVLQQPQSTVSRHLRTLRDAGLIRDRRVGQTVHYSVPVNGDVAGDGCLLRRLLDWVAEQPLSKTLDGRLGDVITRRREMSDRFFDQVGRHWDTLREESFGAAFHLEALISLLPTDWTVADVGTGTGYLLPLLGTHFKRVIAVDPVEAMLQGARHRIEASDVRQVDIRQGDLSSLPIDSGSIDLAIAMLVLHHVPVPQEALAEVFRILRPGGRVLIVEQVEHASEAFRDRMQDRWWGFDPPQLGEMLTTTGFRHVTTNALTSLERAHDAPDLFVLTGEKQSNADGKSSAPPYEKKKER